MPVHPDQLAAAASATGQVVDAISGLQWDAPTPCTGWTVRDLVHHVVAGNHLFAAALDGNPWPTPGSDAAAHLDDTALAGAYRASTTILLDAFRRPRALEQTITVPFGTVPGPVALHLRITELLVHGWDLAHAIGHRDVFSEDLAAQELEFTRHALAAVPADRRPFSPAQPVLDDAPAIDRLAAHLGRSVTAPRA